MKISSQHRLSTRYEITGSPYKEKFKLRQYTKYSKEKVCVFTLQIQGNSKPHKPGKVIRRQKKRVYSFAIYQNHAWACPWSSQRLLLVNVSAGNQWGRMRTTSTGPLFASSLSELNMLVGSFSSFWNQGLIQPRNSIFFPSCTEHLFWLTSGHLDLQRPWYNLPFLASAAILPRKGGAPCLCCSGIWKIRFSSLMTIFDFS